MQALRAVIGWPVCHGEPDQSSYSTPSHATLSNRFAVPRSERLAEPVREAFWSAAIYRRFVSGGLQPAGGSAVGRKKISHTRFILLLSP